MSKKLIQEIKTLKEKISKEEKKLRTMQGMLRAKEVVLQGVCKHPVNKVVQKSRPFTDTLGNYRYSDDWWHCEACGKNTEAMQWDGYYNRGTKEREFKKLTGKDYVYPKIILPIRVNKK
jgi:uncharacterized protein with PIN domain